MCFSASASFTAAAGLGLISLASLKKVRSANEYPFAAIPLLFAMQQFSEGLVWLSTSQGGNNSLMAPAAALFFIFAFVIWPTWFPLSLYLIEGNERRRIWLRFLMLCGMVMSGVYAFLLSRTEILAQIKGNNVCYSVSIFEIVSNQALPLLAYLVPVMLPFFISSWRHMWIFGVAGVLSCFITYLFWQACFISVWCFFAAMLSFMLLALFPTKKES